MRIRLLSICILAMLPCSAALADGVASIPRVHATICGDPLGYVFFGPSATAEIALGDSYSILIGIRDLEQGYIAQKIAEGENNTIEDGLMYNFGIRHYRGEGARLSGWYAGPRVEFGNVDTDSARAYALLAEIDFGHTWITQHRILFGAGVQIGAGAGWNRGTTFESENSDTKYYLVGNFSVFAGIAL